MNDKFKKMFLQNDPDEDTPYDETFLIETIEALRIAIRNKDNDAVDRLFDDFDRLSDFLK